MRRYLKTALMSTLAAASLGGGVSADEMRDSALDTAALDHSGGQRQPDHA